MKTGIVIAAVAAVFAIGAGIYMVDIDMTESGSLPDVNVSVEEGSMPKFDAEVGDVDVGTKEVTVTVPTVDIESPEADEQVAQND